MKTCSKLTAALSATLLAMTMAQAQTPSAVMYDSGIGPIAFGAGKLQVALEANGYPVSVTPLGDPSGVAQPVRVILVTEEVLLPGQPATSGLTNQGYSIQRVADGVATNWWVIGKDVTGAMYGGLELAEAVQLADGLAGVTDRQTNPRIEKRGIKFNIPLDARSPSYSDDSDSAQANIGNMWETNFWSGFLDEMALHRYNLLSLWNLHPFPSLVRVPEYPNVALAGVKKKSGALWNASGTGMNMYDPSWTLTTLKTLTMDEKIAFWRWVMQYAKDRGIDIYLMTWNIFVYGTEPSGYGITTSPSNATTKDYFRKSVRALFNTYPLLAGVGLTTGENMSGIGNAEEEQWAFDTYGLGVSDAMADARNPNSPNYAPNRVMRLIHRAHQADLNQIISYFSQLPGYTNADSTLTFSFKYSQAHMHSSTKPQFIYQNNWFSTIPAGKKTLLTVRNDDLYYMRWGDPDFARAYMTNLPDLSKIAGIYMGPDGYTWGREYLSTEPDSPRQQVIEKMWYYFLLYGRLAYDPTIPNSRFEAILGERFPTVSSSNLFQGWASVSKVFPLLTRFYWGALDFQWYPEACWNSAGFFTVQDFIDPKWDPMQSSEDGDRPLLMSIKQYVDGVTPNGRLNPEQVADQMEQYATNGLASIHGLDPGSDKELRLTLGDINAMGLLGRYYAEKIRGATDLYRYQRTGFASDNNNARTHLLNASNYWSQYAAIISSQYVGQVLTRMGNYVVSIPDIQAQVDADIPPAILDTNKVSLHYDLTTITGVSIAVPHGASVLLVPGDANNLNAADAGIHTRLQNLGFTVQVVSAAAATTADANGKTLVMTSSTVSSGNVNTKFRDVAVPVINWETALQDEYRFTSTTNQGNAASQTSLRITNAAHSLAAGLSAGNHTVASSAGDFSWGEPGGSPTVIARLVDGSHPCIYAYESGGAMIGGNAPARRVHLFLQNNTFDSLKADGLALFDAAIGWVTGLPTTTTSSHQLELQWGGGGNLETAIHPLGPWSAVSGATSPFASVTTNITQFFRVQH